MSRKSQEIVAFGDFQTPDALALQATQLLARLGANPATIIEPTCGGGAFLAAAAQVFPDARLIGVDVNPSHLTAARARGLAGATVHEGNFFAFDWEKLLLPQPHPWLIVGNPPWVTVAGLSAVAGDNAPARSNAANWRGIDALTGKSNFDISEWMLNAYLRWLDGRPGTIAVLCKTTVARKVLFKAWKDGQGIARARIYGIDALRHFGAAVDAGFLVIETSPDGTARTCDVYGNLDAITPSRSFGRIDDIMVSDFAAFTAHRHLLGATENVWRSGIKHDCAAVMELTRRNGVLVNRLGERVDIEEAYLYPLMKSADVANGRPYRGRMMLVPQHAVGEDTAILQTVAPATWRYLSQHAALFDARRSAIYRNRPPFAIFGVGPYSFAPWKIAISGLYKRLNFTCIGPVNGKPVVFDDTVSFLPFQTEAEAQRAYVLLTSPIARQCLESMIFWSDKRPITAQLLRRLSLRALATTLEYAAA